ncbi:MAG: hypothetical protein ACXVP3_05980 [Actinomycetota bacterium]
MAIERPPASTVRDREVVLGLIAAPGTTAEVAAALVVDLPERLAERFPGVTWRLELIEDPLVAPPARDAEIIAAARSRLLEEGWDLAICLTDLPLRAQRRPVVAHASASHGVALISLPALGPFRLRHRVADAAIQMVARLLGSTDGTDERVLGRRVQELGEDAEDAGSVLYAARVLAGNVRLLLGMVAANRPWRLALGLSRALVASIATVAFALVTRDLWSLSEVIAGWRSVVLTILAIGVPVVTIIAGADLLERSPEPLARQQVMLFNLTTVITVVLGILSLYVALGVLTALGALVLVPSSLLSSVARHPVDAGDYLRLTWLATSLGGLAGALGAGLESDEAVRAAAYRSWADTETETGARRAADR